MILHQRKQYYGPLPAIAAAAAVGRLRQSQTLASSLTSAEVLSGMKTTDPRHRKMTHCSNSRRSTGIDTADAVSAAATEIKNIGWS